MALTAVMIVGAACGDESRRGTVSEAPTSTPASSGPATDLPEVVPWDRTGFAPPVTLDLDGKRVRLNPWAYCYETRCVDGSPRRPYEDVGRSDSVAFSFPENGWEFQATFKEPGDLGCHRQITVPVPKTSDRTWDLAPAGPAGPWEVELFGRGPEGGDVITTFAWTTRVDGTLPGPATGTAAVLADHDGELDSYGVEVGIRDLAEQPRQASARITVASTEGRSVTLVPRLQRPCYDEGGLWFTAPEEVGRRATELGSGPFTYRVELVLDGTTYTGRGQWPTGETEEIAPHVPLTWTPDLPAYTG